MKIKKILSFGLALALIPGIVTSLVPSKISAGQDETITNMSFEQSFPSGKSSVTLSTNDVGFGPIGVYVHNGRPSNLKESRVTKYLVSEGAQDEYQAVMGTGITINISDYASSKDEFIKLFPLIDISYYVTEDFYSQPSGWERGETEFSQNYVNYNNTISLSGLNNSNYIIRHQESNSLKQHKEKTIISLTENWTDDFLNLQLSYGAAINWTNEVHASVIKVKDVNFELWGSGQKHKMPSTLTKLGYNYTNGQIGVYTYNQGANDPNYKEEGVYSAYSASNDYYYHTEPLTEINVLDYADSKEDFLNCFSYINVGFYMMKDFYNQEDGWYYGKGKKSQNYEYFATSYGSLNGKNYQKHSLNSDWIRVKSHDEGYKINIIENWVGNILKLDIQYGVAVDTIYLGFGRSAIIKVKDPLIKLSDHWKWFDNE